MWHHGCHSAERTPTKTPTCVLSFLKIRGEITQLRREVSELRCEAGYWKSRHADAVERNRKLEELDQANAEIRKLKADLFGSKKQSSADR